MSLTIRTAWNDANAEWRAGAFYKDLSLQAMSEFESLAAPFSCAGTTLLFGEEQEACSVLFLLEGRVELTINLHEGKRLKLGIVGPGEIVGLAAAIAGCPYETAAVAQYPCKITALSRYVFLDFLLRYPVACQNVARLLSIEYKRGCEQLRVCGLTLTAST
jgi:CRP-like cAMP-binding protein